MAYPVSVRCSQIRNLTDKVTRDTLYSWTGFRVYSCNLPFPCTKINGCFWYRYIICVTRKLMHDIRAKTRIHIKLVDIYRFVIHNGKNGKIIYHIRNRSIRKNSNKRMYGLKYFIDTIFITNENVFYIHIWSVSNFNFYNNFIQSNGNFYHNFIRCVWKNLFLF